MQVLIDKLTLPIKFFFVCVCVQYLGILCITSCGISIRYFFYYFILYTLKMPNISLIEIKYCIWGKSQYKHQESSKRWG